MSGRGLTAGQKRAIESGRSNPSDGNRPVDPGICFSISATRGDGEILQKSECSTVLRSDSGVATPPVWQPNV